MFETRGVALDAEDRETLRQHYVEFGEDAAAERAGVDPRTFMRAVAGGTLYAATWRELRSYAYRLREEKLPALNQADSNLARAITPGIRNVTPRGRAHRQRRP
jgi:hypothetical protein